MVTTIFGVIVALIGLYYLIHDLSCDTPMPGVGVASGCFFIAAAVCFK